MAQHMVNDDRVLRVPHQAEVTLLRVLLTRPALRLVLRPWFDAVALRAVTRWYFPVSRAWAAATVADGDRERFGQLLGGDFRHGFFLERALGIAAARADAYREATSRWETAFFAQASDMQLPLAAAEQARAKAVRALFLARVHFLPLHLQRRIPAVCWDVPSPSTVAERHDARLGDRAAAVAPPDPLPEVNQSRVLRLGDIQRTWLRFRTPVSSVGEYAWARLDERVNEVATAPVFVFAHALGAEPEYWEGLADPFWKLVRAGVRVLQVEGPWHGRRRSPGMTAGAPLIARAPLGIIDYMQAQVAEIAVLVAWARRTGSRQVGIGGLSLGALGAQLAACASRYWPTEVRPDALFLIGTSGTLAPLLTDSALTRNLGLQGALLRRGWRQDDILRWRPLVEPLNTAPLPPERIVIALGKADTVLPFNEGIGFARRWGLEEDDILVHPCGHFSLAFRLFIDGTFFARVATILDAPMTHPGDHGWNISRA